MENTINEILAFSECCCEQMTGEQLDHEVCPCCGEHCEVVYEDWSCWKTFVHLLTASNQFRRIRTYPRRWKTWKTQESAFSTMARLATAKWWAGFVHCKTFTASLYCWPVAKWRRSTKTRSLACSTLTERMFTVGLNACTLYTRTPPIVGVRAGRHPPLGGYAARANGVPKSFGMKIALANTVPKKSQKNLFFSWQLKSGLYNVDIRNKGKGRQWTKN